MIRTLEATVDETGQVHLTEPLVIKGVHRALVMVLDEPPANDMIETALLSEASLAEDWNRPEEDDAWSHLR